MSIPGSPSVYGSTNASLVPFTEEDRTNYSRIFNNCKPRNGCLDGDTARDLLMKSKLPIDVLGQIWSLADTQNRGRLDQVEFSIAMYFVQHFMSGKIKVMPTQLPPELLSAARGIRMRSSMDMSNALGRSNTIVGGNSSSELSRSEATNLLPGYSSVRIPNSKRVDVTPRSISLNSSPYISHNPVEEEWAIKPEEKAKFDRLFVTIDTTKKGYITGEEAVQYFLRSKLSEAILAQIWDLADIRQNGQLDREEFAVSMYLIQMKLSGSELPQVLPRSLIPPAMRKPQSGFVPGASKGPTPSQAPTQSSSLLDFNTSSLDMIGSPPLQGQPSKSGETNKAASNLPNTDIGDILNFSSQTARTNTFNHESSQPRDQQENNLANITNQKNDIAAKYSQTKTLYDAELKVVQGFQDSLRKENEELVSKREELAKIEKEYQQLQMQRKILEEEMEKDKKESNDIKQKIKQLNEEILRLRVENEKMSKENRQQKNLLQVNRGQLASVTSEKKRLENLSIDDHQKININSGFSMTSNPTGMDNSQSNRFNANKSSTQYSPIAAENVSKSPNFNIPTGTIPGPSSDRSSSSSSFYNAFPPVNLTGMKENPFSKDPVDSFSSPVAFSASQPQPQTKPQSRTSISFDDPMFWKSSKPVKDQSPNIFFPNPVKDSTKYEPLLEERNKLDQLDKGIGSPGHSEELESEMDMSQVQQISPKNEFKPTQGPSSFKGDGKVDPYLKQTIGTKELGLGTSMIQTNSRTEKNEKGDNFFPDFQVNKDGNLGKFDTPFNTTFDTSNTKSSFDSFDFNSKFPTTESISNDMELPSTVKPNQSDMNPGIQNSTFPSFGFDGPSGTTLIKDDLHDVFDGRVNSDKKANNGGFDDIFGDTFSPSISTNKESPVVAPIAANSAFTDIFGTGVGTYEPTLNNQPKPIDHFDFFATPQETPKEPAKGKPLVPSRPATSTKEDTPHANNLRELMGMGFTQEQAQVALERYDYDLNKATNFLLDQ
ncbi:hypothetical protein K7432_011712 [Basidiobolus ranarum]|uniref:Epidermal growth factor receptor substrate 15-like 1 n=1 Tax=Basidiobolus ranarum TaxID=34480 RepID=A0ABR2WLZ7_9FUNG